MQSLRELLTQIVEMKASDLHINVGVPPTMRFDGELKAVNDHVLSHDEAKLLCFEFLEPDQIKRFEEKLSVDFSFGIDGVSRFRGNLYISVGNICGAFRPIPHKIPDAAEIGLPNVVVNLSKRPRGLVLVTGPTGSGKSTTLSALLNLVNKTRHDHIVTIEDPIEFLYTQENCVINQREIGKDSHTFADALKYLLRQDPDVVLIGEMRDYETIQSAITIAETGHLVFATLHTNTAVQTIDRIIDVFPPHQQAQVRTQLSFILEGIACQSLVPKKDGGRTLAMEVMVPTSAIRNLIREGKTHQLYSQMQMGQDRTGMMTLDQSLAELARMGIIAEDEAEKRCVNLEDFHKLLKAPNLRT